MEPRFCRLFLFILEFYSFLFQISYQIYAQSSVNYCIYIKLAQSASLDLELAIISQQKSLGFTIPIKEFNIKHATKHTKVILLHPYHIRFSKSTPIFLLMLLISPIYPTPPLQFEVESIININTTPLMSVKGVPGPIEPYFDELKYWNHGDNPAFKKFMKIGMENTKGRQFIDHRTHFIDRGVRLSLARNFDDFLQRDIKAHTFLRSFAVWTLSSMFLFYTHRVCRHLIPVGRYGIRKINETQFFQNFGYLGVAGVGAWWGGAVYAWWKTTKFTVHKFYRHVIQQNRNWIHENLEVSKYGNYVYPESLLSSEETYHASPDKKLLFSKPADEFTYFGPYTPAEKAE